MKRYDIVKTIITEQGNINDNFRNSLEKKLLNKLNTKFNIFTYMKKNILLTVLLLAVLAAGGYFTYKAVNEKNNDIEIGEDNNNQINDITGIANPASVYCEENGGEVIIEEEEDGQAGYCVFDNGNKCEEWSFYRGECTKEQN